MVYYNFISWCKHGRIQNSSKQVCNPSGLQIHFQVVEFSVDWIMKNKDVTPQKVCEILH